MSIEFKIIWDGDIPGLPEHSLRLGIFSDALANLSKALQWTASEILTKRSGGTVSTNYGSAGQLKNEVKHIDFNLVEFKGGSAELTLIAKAYTPKGSTLPLLEDDTLLEESTKKLIDDIESEVSGKSVNYNVHKFLNSIPSNLTKNFYELKIDGVLYKSVETAAKDTPNITKASCGLHTLDGFLIVGFVFAPGPYQVKLRSVDGKGPVYTLEATKELVSKAEKLRGQMVNALSLLKEGQKPKLLWVRAAIGDKPLSPEQRLEHINKTWSNVLQRLAE